MRPIVTRASARRTAGARPVVVLAQLVLAGSLVACTVGTTSPTPEGSGPPPSPQPTPTSEPAPTVSLSPTTAPDPWLPAGDLAGPTRDARLVALPGGGALVVGYDPETGRMTAETWEPGSGSWRNAPPLERPRTDFAAVALRDGRVLVAGGYNENGQSYSSAYVYDPETQSWTKTGGMDTARTNPAAALLPDGRVLVAGGFFYTGFQEGLGPTTDIVLAVYSAADQRPEDPTRPPLDDVDHPPIGYALATAEIYDPATGTWSTTGSLSFARTGPAMATLTDGRVLVVGSSEDNVTRLDPRSYETAELYDPASGRFQLTASLPAIDRHAVEDLGVVLPDGDPAPAANGTLVAVAGGGAILLSHAGWWKHEGEIVRSFRYRDGSWTVLGEPFAWAEDFDAATLMETETPSRLRAAVVGLADGRVLVVGGAPYYQSASPAVARAELFDPSTDTFATQVDMPEARDRPLVVLLADGSALIVGGGQDAYTEADGWQHVELRSSVRFDPGRLDR